MWKHFNRISKKTYPTFPEESFQAKQVKHVFFEKKCKVFYFLELEKELIPNFASNNWQSCRDWKLRVEWNVLLQNSFSMISCFKYCFRSLKKISKIWLKFNGRVDKAAFYVSRTMLLGKTNFSQSSFVCSFFDFHGKDSDFRKRFLSWLLKKYPTCPEDRF